VHVELLMDHPVVAIMCAMNGKGGVFATGC
jgi:hypothetical protein